jgi:hypothetical protein
LALIGTISGSVGPGGTLSTTTAISGSLIIADEPPERFPALPSGAKLFVSGTKSSVGADAPSAIFGGDTFVSGAFGTDSYVQMKPVGTLRIPTNTTASYIYTSGSTNDIYFTQYQPGTGYTNTTRLRWLESNLQTGLQYGGVISSTSGSTTYNISSGSGIIVSQNASLADDPFPTIVQVAWGNLSSQPLPSLSTTQITYIAMDGTGTPYLKSTPFLDGDYEDYIVLGRVLHTDKVGTNGAVNQPQVAYGANQFRGDFVRAFGPIKLSGHTLYVSGTTGLKKDAGDSYAEGRNYSVNPSSPNYVLSTTDTAQNASKIFYEYVNSSGDDVILNNGNIGYTAVDFAQYNNGGTLATVGAGNKFTIQRVFWFPNAVNRAFYVYYGSTIYSTIADAQAGIATEVFTEGKNTRDAAIFLGYLIVKGTLVDFTDPTTYKVIQAGSFRAVASAGAGATGTPGGATTQVQFNDAGVFNGTSDFTFAKSTGTVSMANLIVSGTSAGALVTSGTLQVKSAAGAVVGSISTVGVISGSSDLQAGGNITGSNALLGGNLALNGGSLTSTAATFNLVNTNATTVNFAGGASAALNVGNTAATNTVLGKTKFDQGLSGSLTQLADGTSYIIAGTNVAVTSASNGAITVDSNNIPLSFFGDASDGNATLDGVGIPGWASLAGSIYTMTRDALLRNLTINNTITLRTQGFQPFVKGTLTNNGTYEAKGNDASGAVVGGAFTTAGSWGISAGAGGAAGGPTTGNAAGSVGAGSGGNSIGGGGGKGGDAGAQIGGNGNNSAGPAAVVGSWRDAGFFVRRRLFNGTTVATLNGSGGGGGGAVAGDGVNSGTGGAGGGAAPNCYVFCNILNNAGTIRSLGGNGGNATSAGGTTRAGGGGGGAAGGVIVAANSVISLGTITSAGGAFGNGANGGNNGSPGTSGIVLILTGS